MKRFILYLMPIFFISCLKEQPDQSSIINVKTTDVSDITSVSVRCGGTITSNQTLTNTTYGICWGIDHDPVISTNAIIAGNGSGTFTTTITGLTPNTNYFARAFMYSANDTIYGNEVSFQTIETQLLPYVVTEAAINVTDHSATSGGIVMDEGMAPVTKRGICFSTQPNPTVSNDSISNGSGLGTFLIEMTGLERNTTYYVRAFAINSNGISYGTENIFTTLGNLPMLSTNSVTSIGQTVAVTGGTISDNGGSALTEVGVCWSTNPQPNVNDNHIAQGASNNLFTCSLSGLTPFTTYYVRAYAKNSTGVGYGDEKIFTTLPELPTVSTGSVSQITDQTATGTGTVISSGGAPVTHRGVCWSTQNPPILDSNQINYTDNGTGIGSFTAQMINLTAGTTYYVRAYAINLAGVTYGNTVTFSTAPPPPVRFDYLPCNSMSEFDNTSFEYWSGTQYQSTTWTIYNTGYNGTAIRAVNSSTSHSALGGSVTFTRFFPGNGFVRFWINTPNPGYNNRIPNVYIDGIQQSQTPTSIAGQASSFYWQQFQTPDISAGTHTIKLEWPNSGMYFNYTLDEVECYRY